MNMVGTNSYLKLEESYRQEHVYPMCFYDHVADYEFAINLRRSSFLFSEIAFSRRKMRLSLQPSGDNLTI